MALKKFPVFTVIGYELVIFLLIIPVPSPNEINRQFQITFIYLFFILQ